MGQGDCETGVRQGPGDKNTRLVQRHRGQLSLENVEITIAKMLLF